MKHLHARTLLILVALVLLAAACGQKNDVAQVSSAGGAGTGGSGFDDVGTGGGFDDFGGSGGFDDVGGGTGGVSTDVSGGGTTGGGTGGGTGGTTGGGGATPAPGAGGGGGGATATTAPAAGGGGGGAPAPTGDRTGITADTITLGVHAPVTGAAPIPQTSFEEAVDLYWRYLDDKGGLFGRRVEVKFNDDKFDPATAVAVCKKMATEDKAFLLVGGGGADQITACAGYANQNGIPYLSAGVNEDGLRGVRAYFALSESYAQQSPQLVQMVGAMFDNKPPTCVAKCKIGLATADSGSFNDAHVSIEKAFGGAGYTIVYNERIPKSASQNEALSIAANMQSSGAEVIYFLSSPTTFLNVAAQTGSQNYFPQWIGPGLTSGLNTVASIGCRARRSVDKAIFFSPFPQLDKVDEYDPEFRKAYQQILGGEPDDLAIALWGLNKSIHQMFLAAGEGVTRQSFVQTLESGTAFKTNIFPEIKFSAQNHFGASTVTAVQADCDTSTYKTIAVNVAGF